ncbi:MAG: hypothetical protein UY63_C0017G0078 [Parcubacteria group bacterium GW2011_GWA2_51_10]|nr:MAG: hypothetical protein UY63_C0017G0078 [Parcubacteria group bacterium GW2011_GWA2_51_10]
MKLEKLYRRGPDAHAEQAKKALLDPITDEPIELGEHDRKMSDILDNGSEEDRFLQYLGSFKSAGAAKLAHALMERATLSTTDKALLDGVLLKYNPDRARIEKVQDAIDDDEMFEEILRLSPRIRQVTRQADKEQIVEIFKAEIERLGLKNQQPFAKLVKQLKTVHQTLERPDVASINDSIADALAKSGVAADKYDEILTSGVTASTRAEFTKAAAEQMTTWESMTNFFFKYADKRGSALYGTALEKERLTAECDRYIKMVANTLARTITPEIQQKIDRYEIYGEEIKLDNRNVKTLRDMKNTQTQVSSRREQQARESRYRQYRAEEARKIGKAANALDPGEIDTIRNGFAAQESEELNKRHRGSGILAALLSLLFEPADIRKTIEHI